MERFFDKNIKYKFLNIDFIFSLLIHFPLIVNFNSFVSFYLLILSFIYFLYNNKSYPKNYFNLLIAISFVLIYTYLVSFLNFGYNYSSFYKFFLLLATLIYQLNIAYSVTDFYSYFRGLAISFLIIIILNFSKILNIDIAELQRVEIGLINPIWLARFSGFLFLYFFVSNLIKFRFLKYSILIALLLIIFLSGSKGPFLALIISILYFNKNYFKHILIIIPIIFFLIIFSNQDGLLNFYFQKRFLTLNPNQKEITTIIEGDRVDLFITTIINFFQLNILQIFMGIGIGTSSFLYFNFVLNERWYPHNILLELLYEFGPIILFLFLALLFNIFFKSKDKSISIFVLYFFINSLFSGDLPLNSYIFLFLFIYLKKTSKKYELS